MFEMSLKGAGELSPSLLNQSLHLRTDFCNDITDNTANTQELPVAHVELQQTDYEHI